jgi:hypothetical protein
VLLGDPAAPGISLNSMLPKKDASGAAHPTPHPRNDVHSSKQRQTEPQRSDRHDRNERPRTVVPPALPPRPILSPTTPAPIPAPPLPAVPVQPLGATSAQPPADHP